MDEVVDGVAFHFFAPAVDFVFEAAAGKDGAGALEQGFEDGEFFVAQCDGFALAGDCHLVGGGVEGEGAVAQQGAGALVLAAQDGADAGLQFGHVEGFDEVVVGAAVEAGEAAV